MKFLRKKTNGIVIFFLLLCLFACEAQVKMTFDSNYGVRYCADNNSTEIKINIDPNQPDLVTSLRIVVQRSDYKFTYSAAYELMEEYNDDIKLEKEYPITYFIQDSSDSQRYLEYITINFYMNDFWNNNPQMIFEYLGIQDIVQDKTIIYAPIIEVSHFILLIGVSIASLNNKKSIDVRIA